jgi:putative transposase
MTEKDFAMPRTARVAFAGIPWHIIQRGNHRGACFFSEEDYLVYLDQLKHQSMKFDCAIHAYCLMTNHVHLLLTPDEASGPSLMMKHSGQCFVQYINRTYQRSGTLWEGRFKSCLVQKKDYALQCYRYIEMNPVRAAMVVHPRAYPWSSFHYNGDGAGDKLLTPPSCYTQLGTEAGERREVYRALLESRISDKQISAIRTATSGNYVFGNFSFQHKIANALEKRVTPGLSGRPRKQV